MSNLELLDPALELLACPVCRVRTHDDGDDGQLPLVRDGRQLRCGAGHSFDIAKQGYVNLLGSASPSNADTPAMLAARDRFLASGIYSPIRDTVSRLTAQARTVVEVGAGTGWYLSGVLADRPGSVGLATDVSAAAAKYAARAGMPAVVADTWAGLPIRTGTVDALLCVFAPRKADEFVRLLTPGGRVVVAWPTPRHLAELRTSLGLLDVDPQKQDQLHRQFADVGLRRIDGDSVDFSVPCDAGQLSDLVAMGPNAFHNHDDTFTDEEVTVSVCVEVFSR